MAHGMTQGVSAVPLPGRPSEDWAPRSCCGACVFSLGSSKVLSCQMSERAPCGTGSSGQAKSAAGRMGHRVIALVAGGAALQVPRKPLCRVSPLEERNLICTLVP